MPKVDLNTTILPSNHDIFFARPGSGYRLYADFIAEEAVFLDLPGLDLEPGKTLPEQHSINQRIHRARALKQWYRSKGDVSRPSDDLSHYPAGIGDGGVSQIRSALVAYFHKAKKGDLVLVTPAAYSFDALIGEFVGEPTDIINVSVPRFYGEDALQGRAVRWRARLAKRYLASDLLDIVSKPNIIVTLPKSVRRELYDLVYDGYTINGDFSIRFDVTEHDFTSYDDLLIQSFVNFVAVNTRSFSKGGESTFTSFSDAAFVDAGDFTPELRTEVSSPGFINLHSTKVTPLVVAALFAVAISIGEGAFAAAQNGTLRIGNSQASADDACVADIEAQALNQIKLSGAAGWAEACERARQAAVRTGIRGPARVRP